MTYRTKIRNIQAWRPDGGCSDMDAQVEGEEDLDERHNKAPIRFPRLCCRMFAGLAVLGSVKDALFVVSGK